MSTHPSAPMMWSEMGSVHPSLTLCPSSLACSCVLSWNDALGRNVNPGIGPGGHQLKRFFFPPSVLINCKSFVSRELRMRQRDNVLEELSCSAILSLELATELIQQIINLGSSQTCEEELKANLLTYFNWYLKLSVLLQQVTLLARPVMTWLVSLHKLVIKPVVSVRFNTLAVKNPKNCLYEIHWSTNALREILVLFSEPSGSVCIKLNLVNKSCPFPLHWMRGSMVLSFGHLAPSACPPQEVTSHTGWTC